MAYNFNQKTQEASRQFGIGQNDAFQFQEGSNKFRVLLMAEKPIATHWTANKGVNCIGEEEGCPFHGEGAILNKDETPARPSIKYLGYILDRKDNKVKLMYMPYSISGAIGKLQNSEDYSFEDVPMPYDLTVTYDPNAAPAQMYTVIPSPQRTEVPADYMTKVREMKSLDDIRESILSKQAGGPRKIVTPSGKTVSEDNIPVFDSEEKVKEEDLPF